MSATGPGVTCARGPGGTGPARRARVHVRRQRDHRAAGELAEAAQQRAGRRSSSASVDRRRAAAPGRRRGRGGRPCGRACRPARRSPPPMIASAWRHRAAGLAVRVADRRQRRARSAHARRGRRGRRGGHGTHGPSRGSPPARRSRRRPPSGRAPRPPRPRRGSGRRARGTRATSPIRRRSRASATIAASTSIAVAAIRATRTQSSVPAQACPAPLGGPAGIGEVARPHRVRGRRLVGRDGELEVAAGLELHEDPAQQPPGLLARLGLDLDDDEVEDRVDERDAGRAPVQRPQAQLARLASSGPTSTRIAGHVPAEQVAVDGVEVQRRAPRPSRRR